MTRTIPGQLDYARLANQHRPRDTAGIEAEVRRLHRQGWLPLDIAASLRLAPAEVKRILFHDPHPTQE